MGEINKKNKNIISLMSQKLLLSHYDLGILEVEEEDRMVTSYSYIKVQSEIGGPFL